MTLKTRRYYKLKEEALDRILWRTRFGRGYGPAERLCDVKMMMMMMIFDYFQQRIVKNALGEGFFAWSTHSSHLNFLYLTTVSVWLIEAFMQIIRSVFCHLFLSLTCYQTNSIKKSPVWGAHKCSVIQVIPTIFWNLKISLAFFHISPPPAPIMSQINSFHTLPMNFLLPSAILLRHHLNKPRQKLRNKLIWLHVTGDQLGKTKKQEKRTRPKRPKKNLPDRVKRM